MYADTKYPVFVSYTSFVEAGPDLLHFSRLGRASTSLN